MAEITTPQTIRVRRGDTAEIAASGNGIGGHVWTATVIEGEGRLVELAPTVDPSAGIGAGAVARFALTWHGERGGTVRLLYARPWEKDAAVVRDIAVVVGP